MNPIRNLEAISPDEMERIKRRRPLGTGSEGTVFPHQGKAYKFYQNPSVVKQYFPIRTLYKARERQENIRLTELPNAVILIDGDLGGVIAGNEINGINYRSWWFWYGHTLQAQARNVSRTLVDGAEELTDNYIYPKLKDDQPNVMVTSRGAIGKIIDLDGSSAIYEDQENIELLHQVQESLNKFIIPQLFPDVTLSDDYYYYMQEFNYYWEKLKAAGCPEELIFFVLLSTTPNYDQLREIIDWSGSKDSKRFKMAIK